MSAYSNNKLNPYLGPLTPKLAAEGIEAAKRNAQSLLSDSQLLLKHGRWARAASIAILAIEEVGKIPLIRGLLLAVSSKDLKTEWRAYRSHTKKNVMGAFPLYLESSPNLEDFRSLFDESTDHPRLFDSLKQIGFYSDCLGNCHWSIPSDVIDESLARGLIDTAVCLVGTEDSAMTSEPELDIWIRHMKPVWRDGMFSMKQALIRCYQEAEETGVLKGKNSVEDLVRFIL